MGRFPFCFHWHFDLIPSFPLHSRKKYKSFRKAQSGLFFLSLSAKVTLAIDGVPKSYHTPFPQLSFLSSFFPTFVLFSFLKSLLEFHLKSSPQGSLMLADLSISVLIAWDIQEAAFPAWQCTCSSNSGQPGAVSGQLQLLLKPALV